MDLQSRINRYLPLNSLEETLKYLFLNNTPLDQIDYGSRTFQRNVRPEKNLTQEETICKFREFISKAADGSYMTTDMYIPNGRSLYIRKYPRYLFDSNHYHKDALEINVVLQGEFYQKINGQILRLFAGDICFVAPKTKHASRSCDDSTIVLSVIVYQNVIKELVKRIEMEEGTLQIFFNRILLGKNYHPFLICRTGADDDLAGMIMDMEENQDEQSTYTDMYMKSGLELFLLRLLMKYKEKFVLGNDIAKDESDILNLMDYIEINYKTVTLNALAEAFNYSAGYLSSLIKQRFGRSFQSIITDLKMEQAVKLLESTDANMSTISEAVGYSDKSYFLRRFQKRYHMTPSEYRRKNNQKQPLESAT